MKCDCDYLCYIAVVFFCSEVEMKTELLQDTIKCKEIF